MRKKFASVIYDRKKELETKGLGSVEIYLVLNPKRAKKYITLKKCTSFEWKRYSKSAELQEELRLFTEIAKSMYTNHEPMTFENFEAHLGYCSSPT